jgi:Flp pilus assembly protein TadD
MLDALRHHKASPPDRDGAAKRRAAGHNVPAPLAHAFEQTPPEGGASAGKRLALALLLVAVTALLVWQVAAMNGLLPAGPLSRILKPASAERALPLAAARPPSRAALPSGPGAGPAAGPAPAGPASQAPPAAAVPEQSEAYEPSQPPAAMPKPAGAKVQAPPPAVPRAEAASVPSAQVRQQATAPAVGAGGVVKNETAATAKPGRPAAETDHFRLALYYQRVGDFENALIHYRAVLAADEFNAEAHNNLGVLYQDKGLYDEAIKEFQRATFIDPGYDKAHNNLGVALLRSGKTDAAIAEFRGIVARAPRHVDALTNLALALKAAGRAEEARETLQRVLTINGRHAQAHYNLALIYEERAEWQRAIEHFEQFLANAGPESAALTVDVRTRVQALRLKLQ